MNRLYPSMMCVNPDDTREYCRIFEENGIAGLHIDIMDGSFVPNFTLGTDYCRYLHEITPLPLDIHLMIDRPEDKIKWFPIKEGDIVSVHAESTNHLCRAMDRIRDAGGLPYVAINPATPLSAIEEVLPLAEGILVMTINPGFAGQKLIEPMIDKVARTRQLFISAGYPEMPLEIDGNVSAPNLLRLKAAGADMFVIGSSGFLNSSCNKENLALKINEFKSL
ncbi:MAG: ribulose-phosphate 3-epimerase [Eubacteriales bacterium]